MGVMLNEYDLPSDVPCAAQFHLLSSLCDGLNMDVVSAARYMYEQLKAIPHIGLSSGRRF